MPKSSQSKIKTFIFLIVLIAIAFGALFMLTDIFEEAPKEEPPVCSLANAPSIEKVSQEDEIPKIAYMIYHYFILNGTSDFSTVCNQILEDDYCKDIIHSIVLYQIKNEKELDIALFRQFLGYLEKMGQTEQGTSALPKEQIEDFIRQDFMEHVLADCEKYEMEVDKKACRVAQLYYSAEDEMDCDMEKLNYPQVLLCFEEQTILGMDCVLEQEFQRLDI